MNLYMSHQPLCGAEHLIALPAPVNPRFPVMRASVIFQVTLTTQRFPAQVTQPPEIVRASVIFQVTLTTQHFSAQVTQPPEIMNPFDVRI